MHVNALERGLPFTMKSESYEQHIAKFLTWATGCTLALCLYIASDALEKLEHLDTKVDSHEVRITLLEIE